MPVIKYLLRKPNIWFIWLCVCISPIYSQSYFNVRYPDGSYRNKSVQEVRKITFSNGGTDLSIYLTDGDIVTNSVASMTFSFGTSGSGSPLPVELTGFSVKIKSQKILLIWRTSTEVGNHGFEIERRQEPTGTWQKIGFVHGSGNSNSPKDYVYTDSILWGHKLYYRLKQIDTDGKFSYSEAISINPGNPMEFQLRQNFPNPFNPATIISYSLPKGTMVHLSVYNTLGEEVATLVNEYLPSGDYETTFNGNALPSGIYIYRLVCAGYTKSVRMILVK